MVYTVSQMADRGLWHIYTGDPHCAVGCRVTDDVVISLGILEGQYRIVLGASPLGVWDLRRQIRHHAAEDCDEQ